MPSRREFLRLTGLAAAAAATWRVFSCRAAGMKKGKSMDEKGFQCETPAFPSNPPATWLTYHLAHPGPGGAMPGDPNCAIWWKGRYHLHYIYQHKDGHCFAHVSSKDMLRWTWHPTTLTPPITGHGMFSGTALLTKEGKPAIIYHGQGSGRNQLAFALDDKLEKWTKPEAIIPMTADGKEAKIRNWDPDCWLRDGTYYSISGGGPPHLVKSTDLKKWQHIGPLLHEDTPKDLGVNLNEDVSCANMYPIGDKWMLLCISHKLGCRYYLGGFKDEKYLPEFHAMMNWNKWDFFAPESLLTPDKRRIMWAWCLLKGLPIQAGIQSLPRELSLPADGVLRINPLRELEKLRYDEQVKENVVMPADAVAPLPGISGDTNELKITFAAEKAKRFGLRVYCKNDNSGGFAIMVCPADKVLMLGEMKVPFEPPAGEDVELRVFLDRSMIEVFANGRQAAIAGCKYDPKDLGVTLVSEGGPALAKEVRCWKMKSIYA